jgi:hypothetical protein
MNSLVVTIHSVSVGQCFMNNANAMSSKVGIMAAVEREMLAQ